MAPTSYRYWMTPRGQRGAYYEKLWNRFREAHIRGDHEERHHVSELMRLVLNDLETYIPFQPPPPWLKGCRPPRFCQVCSRPLSGRGSREFCEQHRKGAYAEAARKRQQRARQRRQSSDPHRRPRSY